MRWLSSSIIWLYVAIFYRPKVEINEFGWLSLDIIYPAQKQWLLCLKIELLRCTKGEIILQKQWLLCLKVELLRCTKGEIILQKQWLLCLKVELLRCTKGEIILQKQWL